MNSLLPDSLIAALAALVQALNGAGVPVVVVGGVAASLMGRPRFTRDIDALVDLDEGRWPDIVDAARPLGIEPRPARFRAGACEAP